LQAFKDHKTGRYALGSKTGLLCVAIRHHTRDQRRRDLAFNKPKEIIKKRKYVYAK